MQPIQVFVTIAEILSFAGVAAVGMVYAAAHAEYYVEYAHSANNSPSLAEWMLV